MSCLENVIKEFKGQLSDKDIGQVYDKALKIVDKHGTENLFDLVKKLMEEKKRYVQGKQKVLNHIMKLEEQKGKIDKLFDIDGVTSENAKDILYSHISSNGKYQIDSIETHFAAKSKEYNDLFYAIEKAGYLDLLKDKKNNPQLFKDVVQSVWELSKKRSVTSPDKATKEIAELIHGTNKKRLLDMKAAGYSTGELEGYVFSNSYDPAMVRSLGLKGWMDNIDKFVNKKAMADKFGLDLNNPEQAEEFNKILVNMYEHISKKDSMFDPKRDALTQISKETNDPTMYLNNVEKSRVLEFTDGNSFYEFFQTYNDGNLMTALRRDFRKTARAVSASTIFGTYSRNGLQNVIEHVNARLLEKGLPSIDASTAKGMEDLYNMATGRNSYVDNMTATFANNTKKIADMALLQFAGIKAGFSDPAYSGAIVSDFTGENYYSTFAKMVGKFAASFSDSSMRKELASRMGIQMDSFIMEGMDDILGQQGLLSGGLTKAHEISMKLAMIPRQAAAMRTVTAAEFAFHIHDLLHGKLDAKTSAKAMGQLSRYGFTPDDLKIMKELGTAEFKGTALIEVRKMRDASPEDLKRVFGDKTYKTSTMNEKGRIVTQEVAYSAEDYRQLVNKTADRYSAFLHDKALTGSPTPTQVNIYKLAGMRDPSTPVGALSSLIMMYKGFALSTYRVHRSLTWSEGINKGNWLAQYGRAGIANTVATSTIMGGLSLMVVDVLKGNSPRDPSRPQFLLESMTAGGSMGLYFDYMTENYAQGKKDFVKDVVGPVAGRMVPDAAELVSDAKEAISKGKAKPMRNSMTNAMRWMPSVWFSNMMYDRMVKDKIQQWANPRHHGMERKNRKDMSGKLWKQQAFME